MVVVQPADEGVFRMTSSEPFPTISVDEYLELEEESSVKHEFVDGEIFEMTGGTQAHNLISTNIFSIINKQARDNGCRAFVSDVKVRVDATNSFYYPDVLVDCGSYVKNSVYSTLPSIIFEVLSPSTAAIDRREKALAYKRIPTLKAYVIVQQAYRRVETYVKGTNCEWTKTVRTEGMFELEICHGNSIAMSVEEIYMDTEVPDRPDMMKVLEEAAVYSW